MKRTRVSNATFAAALIAQRKGRSIDEQFLASKEDAFKRLAGTYPREVADISHKEANPPGNPFAQIDVEISDAGIRRLLPSLDALIERRLVAIRDIVLEAVRQNPTVVRNIQSLLADWMKRREIVRVVGAGRALLAASLPANRLAHGEATVSILNDRSPLPNSKLGGGVIAVSASGKTGIVLDIMKHAQNVNRERTLLGQSPILVIGFSSAAASEFASLCTPGYFLGFRSAPHSEDVVLRALGDLEEYAASELFDALVVAAGLEQGVNFLTGHEDLVGSATGPWHQHWK